MHNGHLYTLIEACVAVDTPDVIYRHRIFKEIFGDKLGTQRITGHQHGLTETDLIAHVNVWCYSKVFHFCVLLIVNCQLSIVN